MSPKLLWPEMLPREDHNLTPLNQNLFTSDQGQCLRLHFSGIHGNHFKNYVPTHGTCLLLLLKQCSDTPVAQRKMTAWHKDDSTLFVEADNAELLFTLLLEF